MISGTDELAAEILGLEARIGRPMGISGGIVQEVSDPKFATGVGLVMYGLRPEMISGTPFRTEMGLGSNGSMNGDGLVQNIANRMKTWFDEL